MALLIDKLLKKKKSKTHVRWGLTYTPEIYKRPQASQHWFWGGVGLPQRGPLGPTNCQDAVLVSHTTITPVDQVNNVLCPPLPKRWDLPIYPSTSTRHKVNNNKGTKLSSFPIPNFWPPVCFQIRYVQTQSGFSVINTVHSASPVTIQFGNVNDENDGNKAKFTKGWNNVCFWNIGLGTLFWGFRTSAG